MQRRRVLVVFVRRLRRIATAIVAFVVSPLVGAQPLDTDAMNARLQACTACHGREGRASSAGYLPRIAGKPAGYLYQQLLAFRAGQRQNATMATLLDPLSDAYLREIAEHFAQLDLPYPPPQLEQAPAAVLAHGEMLVKRGDATRSLPACVACHGDAMTGLLPATPGLLGLPRDYLVAQFGAWRNGLRRARAPDCMGEVARRLDPADIEAVTLWLASQPVPARSHAPAPPAGHAPPIACAK